MSQPYLPKQPDLKIINYKPGPKAQRLSKSELIEIEPLVLNLHGQGQSREAMRAQCSTLVQKPITLPQLDTIRQRLGLAVYDKSKACSNSRIETDESEMVPGFEHDPQGAEASRSDFRTRERQKDSIMSIEEDITALKRQSFSHGSFRTQHEIVPNEDTPMADAEQPPGREETPDPALAISSTSPVFDQDPAEAKRPASNAEICDLVATFARWDPDYKEWLSNAIVHGGTPALALVSLKGIGLTYKPSKPCWKLYRDTLQQNKDDEDAMIRLNHAAILLHTMKAPEAAFDIFFSIYKHFSIVPGQKSSVVIHKILSTVGCARSARNVTHFEVSMAMLDEICEELLATHHVKYLGKTSIWKLLDTLKAHSEKPLELEALQSKGFMALYTQLPVYSCGFKNITFEIFELWSRNAEGGRDVSPMQRLQCDSINIHMVGALEATRLYVKRRPDLADYLLRDQWDRPGHSAAQILSFLLLGDRVFQTAFQHKSDKDRSSFNLVEFPYVLEEQALAFVPFLLMERIIHDELSGGGGTRTRSSQRPNPSSTLLRTIDKVTESIKSTLGYAAVIGSYISHISQTEMTPSKSSQAIPEDQLMETAGIAMNAISPADLWLRTKDKSQSELPGTAMKADTASICGTIAQSYTSSNSSNFRSFKSIGNRARRLAASIGLHS